MVLGSEPEEKEEEGGLGPGLKKFFAELTAGLTGENDLTPLTLALLDGAIGGISWIFGADLARQTLSPAANYVAIALAGMIGAILAFELEAAGENPLVSTAVGNILFGFLYQVLLGQSGLVTETEAVSN